MLRRVLVTAAFAKAALFAHVVRADDDPPAASDDDDDDEAETDDPHGVHQPTDSTHASETEDDDEGQGEDEDEHRHHGHTHHEPGLGLEWITSRARLRLGLAVQSLARYGHDSIPSADTMDLTVRRARVSFDAEVSHGTGFRVELQAKDTKLGIADLYGRWALDEHIEIQAGFLHAPGGLERDTNPFDLPFMERSSLASMTKDREIGLKLVGHQDEQFWQVSITRDAPIGIGGDDPEFAIQYPKDVDPTAVQRSATTWNQAARVGTAPSDEFAVGLDWTLRIRNSQPDYGDPAYESMGSVFLDPRPYRGTSVRVGGDAALSEDNFRVLMEASYRRDGQQLSYDPASGIESRLPGHEWWTGGYLVFGISPDGGYGRAVDGAPLQYGWEIVGRFEAMQVKPVDAFAAHLFAESIGFNWVATRQIRIQLDATLEQMGAFDQTEANDNANATRFYGELWATWKL
ncbi:MAG: hypothetical protein QM831_37830 [Kofleriaceae bacterium]